MVALSRSEAVANGDLDSAFRQIVKAAASTSRAGRVGIWRYGPGRVVLSCIWQYDLKRGRFAHGEDLAATEYPEYFRALDSEVVVAAAVAQRDRRTRELRDSYLVPHGICSMLDAPILVGGKLWGVLCLEAVARVPRRWSTSDKLFSRALADTAALAVEAASRRDAAEEQRRREAYFRSLLEAGCELVAVLNGDGKVLYLSPGSQRILNRPPADSVGRAFFEFVHPYDAVRITEGFRRLKENAGASVPFQVRLRRPDGSWRHLEGTARNLLDDIAVGGIVAGGADTTERRWAELKVRALLGVAQDIGGTLDPPVLLRRVHRRAAQVLSGSLAATVFDDGVSPERVIAHEEWTTRMPEGRQKEIEELADRLTRLVAAGAPVAINSADEAEGDLLKMLDLDALAAVPLEARGRRFGTFVLGRRTPERFERRELALLAAIAKELAAGIDTAALYRGQREEAEFSAALSRVGYELLSVEPSRLLERVCELTVEVLPCDFSRTIVFDEERGVVQAAAMFGETEAERAAVQGLKIPVHELQHVIDKLDREEVVVEPAIPWLAERFGWKGMCLVALRQAGRLVGAQSAGQHSGPLSARQLRLLRGIAQLASLGLQTRILVTSLEQANRVKSDFISMMSHELRTPLNIHIAYTAPLTHKAFGDVSEEQMGALERVESGARGLMDLITTTLDLSRLERGNVTLDVGPVDLAALVGEVEAQCRSVLDRPLVSFVTDVAPDLPRLVTDRGKLRVILSNLVANAFRFTETGEVRVRARRSGDGLQIEVVDTGIGIAPESQSEIFEAFRQAETELPLRQGGVGLGLYVVRRLLDLLQGRIEVESTPGYGATFRIWIPLEI